MFVKKRQETTTLSQRGNIPNTAGCQPEGPVRPGNTQTYSAFISKGLTAIELAIITSVVAVIAVFLSPLFSKTVMETDFDLAIEITESFVDHARATARVYNADVFMRIEPDNALGQQAITLIIPKMQKAPALMEVKEQFLLPAGVRLFSDNGIIHFKPNGEIVQPDQTMVLFNEAHDESRQFVIH